MTATTGPTLLEELHALEVTAHRLATERHHALAEHADLLEANCRLQQQRDWARKAATQATQDLIRERHTVTVRDAAIKSLRIDADDKNTEIRRLNARIHQLAIENENLRTRHERDQQEPPTVRKNWLSRRIGNQL